MRITDPSPAHSRLTGIAALDHGQIIGAHPGRIGGTAWSRPGWSIPNLATTQLTINRLYYLAIYVGDSTSFTRIGCNVSAAGAGGTVARLGIYNVSVQSNRRIEPGSLLVDAGTVSVATTGDKEIVIAQTLERGFYFLAISSDGTPTMFRPSTSGIGITPVIDQSASPASVAGINLTVALADGAAALVDPAPAPDALRILAHSFAMLRF